MAETERTNTEFANSGGAWLELRRMMPCTRKWAYFDHAAVAPISAPAQAALVEWANDFAENGCADWPQWAQELEQVRRSGAELISAATDELALVHNTTEGVNLVAEGFPWQEGDNVVVPADEFPTNLYPWLNLGGRGVEVRRAPVDEGRVELDRLAAACDSRTRIVAVSWVGYASGWRNDVDALVELAHSRGALLFLDAIQGLGVFSLDVRKTPVDFLAADGHKWLLGPEGAGLFYLRREHLDRLRPLGVGWNSVAHAYDFNCVEMNLKPAAARYEGGTYNMPGLAAFGASLELLATYPTEQIAARVLAVTDELCERLARLGAKIASCREPQHASGIVSFELPGRNPALVRKACREQQVLLSCRGGRLRASPHAYCNADDLDRLIAALGSC
ncbi:MAG TPA: aminotransferase class V-fold PLP-dependent enzyme [Pirellulales bacterium]|nr:aminotransferase class V-fold PLP-dependent enzyme [Pirellulales bacterium]